MKPDINLTLNKLLTYALDNLLLDTLDTTYTLNRLAAVCGIKQLERNEDADYGDASLKDLLSELASVKPDADLCAVENVLFPMPRTVSYYFSDTLDRNSKKAFDFIFELYSHGYNRISDSEAIVKDGYVCYHGTGTAPAAVILPACDAAYAPRVLGNHIGALENTDILVSDVVSREAAFVTAYGGAIAAVLGEQADYCVCDGFALTSAPVREKLATDAVKVALLDYPVPALAFNGIAKNSVMREVSRVAKKAADAGVHTVVAAAAKDGVTFYLVFANALDAGDYLERSDALTACGVFQTTDCTPLLSVLEKGTALSTDLAEFKPVYDVIGGVKHGAKAKDVLGGWLVDKMRARLGSAASTDAEHATAFVKEQ